MKIFTAICRSIAAISLLAFSANALSDVAIDQASPDRSLEHAFNTQDVGFIERTIKKPKDFIDMETWIKGNYAEATVSPIFYLDPLSVHSYQIPAGLNMGKYAVAFETYEFGKRRLNALAEGKNASLILDSVNYPTEQQIEDIIQKKNEKRIGAIINSMPVVGRLLKFIIGSVITSLTNQGVDALCSKFVNSSGAISGCYKQALNVCKGGVMAIYQTKPTCPIPVKDGNSWKVQAICNVQCLEYK